MKRAVRMLIRLVAAGLIIFGVMWLGLQLAQARVPNGRFSIVQTVLGFCSLAAGVGLLVRSRRLADRWTEDFDE